MSLIELLSTTKKAVKKLFQEILCKVFAQEQIQITFPNLSTQDINKIVELECYKALRQIRAILDDDSLEDSECFAKIEGIVCVFDSIGASRHDFGSGLPWSVSRAFLTF